MKNIRIKNELEVVETRFTFSEYGNYYFKDSEGNYYYWNTNSERACSNMKEGTKHTCSFELTGRKWHKENVEYEVIKNVRF